MSYLNPHTQPDAPASIDHRADVSRDPITGSYLWSCSCGESSRPVLPRHAAEDLAESHERDANAQRAGGAVDQDVEATEQTGGVLYEITRERSRQDAKWGPQNHPDGTGERYSDRAAMAARMVCQAAAERGDVTWKLVLGEEVAEAFAESDPAKLRAELVQVAAVATAWIEAIDRRTGDGAR